MTYDSVAFRELPADAFPFDIEAWDADTEEILWTRHVSDAGMLEIPGKPDHVREVKIRITYGSGEVIEL